jgi:hypothetical protein
VTIPAYSGTHRGWWTFSKNPSESGRVDYLPLESVPINFRYRIVFVSTVIIFRPHPPPGGSDFEKRAVTMTVEAIRGTVRYLPFADGSNAFIP